MALFGSAEAAGGGGTAAAAAPLAPERQVTRSDASWFRNSARNLTDPAERGFSSYLRRFTAHVVLETRGDKVTRDFFYKINGCCVRQNEGFSQTLQ